VEAGYALFAVVQEIDNHGDEQSGRRQAELGRLLAAADGYQVVASDGTQLGRLDHVRYQRYAVWGALTRFEGSERLFRA
jgi:hypothetical protein